MGEWQAIAPGVVWIVGTILSFLSLIGIGALVKMALSRYWENRDKQSAQHTNNQGKAIDADVAALKMLGERVVNLETKFDKLQEDHSSLMAKNAGIEKENEHLKAENTRLERRIEASEKQSAERLTRIRDLERQVHDLAEQVAKLKTGQRAAG